MVSDSVSVSSSSQSAESSSPPPILVSYLVARVGGITVRYPPTDRSGRSVKGGEVSLLSKEDTRIRERDIWRELSHKKKLKSTNRTRKQPP